MGGIDIKPESAITCATEFIAKPEGQKNPGHDENEVEPGRDPTKASHSTIPIELEAFLKELERFFIQETMNRHKP